MHTNIKNGLVKHLKNDETNEAFQEFIDQNPELKIQQLKSLKIQKSQNDDLIGKLDFVSQINSKFIDQQQRIDMKTKNQETQVNFTFLK